jgi:hypothetical protein
VNSAIQPAALNQEEEVMAKRTVHRGAVVGVFMLAVLVLVLTLIPGTSAEEVVSPGRVGVYDYPDLSPCWMYDQDEQVTKWTEDIFINLTPGSNFPPDVVAVLKCQTTMDNDSGSAITFSGNTFLPCHSFFDAKDPTLSATTTSWTQTISASGNASLSCHFKRNPNF